MADPGSANNTVPATSNDASLGGGSSQGWNWHPDLPIKPMPVFTWPFSPAKFARWFGRTWLTLSNRVVTLVISIATWLYLQPALERCREFELGWLAQMYARNIALMLVVAGGLHLYLITFGRQGVQLKYDRRPQAQNNKAFTFNNQVWDNMFWSLASGVTVWTAFEAVSMWAFANGYIQLLSWQQHPVLFICWLLLIPVWNSAHFFVIHRILHHPALYQRFHALHHRNTNVGPWAGISMHPLEHLMYFSAVAIHWVVISHPVHVIYNLQFLALNAVYGHSGFENILIRGKRRMSLGTFYHQLHHRYFECNYGTAEVPIDQWANSFHDGSVQARERIRQRRAALGN
ncbi:MAG: sterol desaturase family protein [Burkholderiaceae bacterium]